MSLLERITRVSQVLSLIQEIALNIVYKGLHNDKSSLEIVKLAIHEYERLSNEGEVLE